MVFAVQQNNNTQQKYSDAVRAYQQGDIISAYRLLNNYKLELKVESLSDKDVDTAMFEALVSYKYGVQKQDTGNILKAKNLSQEFLGTHTSISLPLELNVRILLAESLFILGQYQAAYEASLKVIELDKKEEKKAVRLKLMMIMNKLNKFEQCYELSKKVVKWPEHEIQARFTLLEMARQKLDKELTMEQTHALANVLEKLSLNDRHRLIAFLIDNLSDQTLTEELILKARKLEKNSQAYHGFYAIVKFHQKDYQFVIDQLSPTIAKWPEPSNQLSGYYWLAKSYDKLGQYDKAFNSFSKSAKLQEKRDKAFLAKKRMQKSHIDTPKRYKSLAVDQLDFVTGDKLLEKNNYATPIFLMGFPRSGTTLLDTVLGTQKQISVMSERNMIAAVVHKIEHEFNLKYPEQLAELTQLQIEQLQGKYFEIAKEHVEDKSILNSGSEHILIDKMPMHSIDFPLIKIMFPRAKFIFALRHPMDVVLSCFQQSFTKNAQMSFLNTLESATQRYIDVMQHFEDNKHIIDENDLLYNKYEDVVENFDEEITTVMNFLGVTEIDDAYKTFDKLNTNKLVTTSSKDQVNKGLYSSSMNKWMNYSPYIRPQLKKLDDFIKHWGYQV